MKETLDIGCGGSQQYPQHTIRGNIKIDILKPQQKTPNFIQADAHNLPFKNNTFNKINMYDIIEHLNSPKTAITQAKNTLKNNGTITITTPNALYLPKIIAAATKGNYKTCNSHITTYGKPELTNLLKQTNLQATINYTTYTKPTKTHQKITQLIPIPALKHRQLKATATKPKKPEKTKEKKREKKLSAIHAQTNIKQNDQHIHHQPNSKARQRKLGSPLTIFIRLTGFGVCTILIMNLIHQLTPTHSGFIFVAWTYAYITILIGWQHKQQKQQANPTATTHPQHQPD